MGLGEGSPKKSGLKRGGGGHLKNYKVKGGGGHVKYFGSTLRWDIFYYS